MNTNASPDLADIIITYIKSLWPKAACEKTPCAEWGPHVFAISINGNMIGIVNGDVFATWNFDKHKGDYAYPTDKKFFKFVKYWAIKKGGLGKPSRSRS